MSTLSWLSNALWFVVAFVAVLGGVYKNYSDKPFSSWSRQRKLYFSCWSSVVLISFINGFRVFIENPTFNFYAQLGLGVQTLLIAVVPCGIEFFNKPWPMRRLRDLFLVVLGALQIFFAF